MTRLFLLLVLLSTCAFACASTSDQLLIEVESLLLNPITRIIGMIAPILMAASAFNHRNLAQFYVAVFIFTLILFVPELLQLLMPLDSQKENEPTNLFVSFLSKMFIIPSILYVGTKQILSSDPDTEPDNTSTSSQIKDTPNEESHSLRKIVID